jgi:hypothetical protein
MRDDREVFWRAAIEFPKEIGIGVKERAVPFIILLSLRLSGEIVSSSPIQF